MFKSFLLLSVAAVVQCRSNYELWCLGTGCSKNVNTTSLPGAVLMGGGTDTDEAFAWQIRNAKGGDFLIMRGSGDDAYNKYVYDMSVAIGAKLNSVTTILFNNAKASSDSVVLDTIRNAEAIFFAGGDQGQYIDYWANTEVQTIIQSKLTTVTVGGTSAGLAVLGNWVYTAENGSVYSDEAMADPYNKYMTFTTAFLRIPFMSTIITDTHFVTRDRMGRMLSFVARILTDSTDLSVARGVGVDEHTALLLDVTTGDVQTVGVGTAYVCTPEHNPEICLSGTPLTFHDINCVRLSGVNQDTFSFDTFTGAGVKYVNTITAGHLTDFPYGPKA